jgi:tellurium resistance protein TerD
MTYDEPEQDDKLLLDVDEMNKVKKGDSVNLTKIDPTMRQLIIGVGWDVKSFEGERVDMDASAFLLNRDGETREDEDFVFYNNLKACEGAVRHTGDNRTGAGDGDDETIFVDLNGIPFDIEQVVFVVSIYQGDQKDQRFTQVRNTFLRVVNQETGNEICRFDIDVHAQDSPESTAMIVASIVREGPKWVFYALGELVDGGLPAVATKYGIIVQF